MKLTLMSLAAVLLALLTLIFPHWLEAVGVDPDGGNGSAEVIVALVVLVAAAVSLVLRLWHPRAGYRRGSGWWASLEWRTRYGSAGRSMEDGSFWALLEFFLVPTAYHVWKYRRQHRAGVQR